MTGRAATTTPAHHDSSAHTSSDSASSSPPPALPPAKGRGWILDANTPGSNDASNRESKREYHREHMVAFRQRKKQSLADMRALHAALEAQLARRLTQRRALLLSGCPLGGQTRRDYPLDAPTETPLTPAERLTRFREIYGDLLDETELRRARNAALREQLERFARLKLFLHHELGLVALGGDPEPEPHATKEKNKTLSELPGGFFVYFEAHEPPFYFEPFSLRECDAATRDGYAKVRELQDAFDCGSLGVREVECLGWRAQRSIERMLLEDGSDGALVSRVRFTKMMHCARGQVESTVRTLAAHAYEWLSSAEKYSRIQRTKFVSHTLQTFGKYHHVSLRNAPEPGGTTNVRYLHLLTRVDDTYTSSSSGNEYARSTVLMLAMDSPRHKLLRETMIPRDDIFWMTEGTAFLSFVQLDDDAFEVDFGNVAACVSDEQAQYYMIELGAHLLRWECLVMPPRLLAL